MFGERVGFSLGGLLLLVVVVGELLLALAIGCVSGFW
jgi:hypothetical protein